MSNYRPLAFTNIASLYTGAPNNGPVSGTRMHDACSSIGGAYLIVSDGKIDDFGRMSGMPALSDDFLRLNCAGRLIIPAFCDSHSHIVYHESREVEFVDRIKGLSYEEIAKKGGGILNSASRLREASEDELYEQASKRLREVIGFGTGALEVKSGYGLTLDSELKMLRVIRRLKEESPIPIKATFLGAHAIPKAYTGNRRAYVDHVIEDMLPAVAAESLADYCDVFCETGFFTQSETEEILSKAKSLGMEVKVHANELDFSGGVQAGTSLGAVSVDHLECVGEDEIRALQNSDTMATLLPSTAFFLDIDYAPARMIMEADVPVAIASDYNPGTTPSGKMPFVWSLAAIKLKMTPEEGLIASTMNGACAMGLEDELGNIAVGKRANFILTKEIEGLSFIPYAFGSDHIERVYINGVPQ